MKFFLTLALLFSFFCAHAQQAYTRQQYKDDFNYFWTTMNEQYCYFDKKHVDWNQVKAIYQPQADTISSRNSLITLLEKMIYEVYDHHCGLRTRTASSRRLVPTGTDVWAEYDHGLPRITEVRQGFGAEKVGITAGMEVIAVNGVPIEQAILPILSHTRNAASKGFALRLCLAGDHQVPRHFRLKTESGIKDYYPDRDSVMLEHITYPRKVESRIFGNTGYIKLNNCLGDNQMIPQFDSVLNSMMHTRALIIDMRETPSGGNTTVARAILGRFINKDHFYQKHEYYAEEKENGVKRSWVEIVSPRGEPYLKPVAILCDHWTGSVGEGITIGFDAMKRAAVIGTSMAGLNGAIYGFQTPNLKIGFNLPTERLYHVNGLPRENYRPVIQVDLTSIKTSAQHDVILNQALKYLKTK